MRLIINFLLNLPWWGALAVIAALAAIGYGLSLYFRRQFDNIVRDAVLNMGVSLQGAEATVHSVTPASAPAGPSPYDLKEDDEQYMEGLDGESWDEKGSHFYTVEATITPADPQAAWDPTILALVPFDFEPADPTENSTCFAALHSAEIFIDGRFRPAVEGDVRGAQRLRMLFGMDERHRAMKFASGVQYFGKVDLPVPAMMK
jgi:hypothetical protein